ncbi:MULTISPECIES: hypothetical protein [Sphingomonas]|uniref:hypothetical protein n=1 Tax=Sphingomonas TaxID=13687 RepID=UPI0008330B7F|nr:hypothetical protein [Sphingomonas sp. CCH10-B3]
MWIRFPSLAATLLVAAITLPLAACGGASGDNSLDALDAELSDGNAQSNVRDPALTSALHDQIMVDPNLASQSNRDAIRPPSQPYAAPVPNAKGATVAGDVRVSEATKTAPAPRSDCPNCKAQRDSMTLGGLAARQGDKRTAACAADVSYSTRWSLRLPADLPLYPDAHVVEAAGTGDNGCALRVVSFTSRASVQSVIDFYYTRATNAGYSADHQADAEGHVLAGTRRADAYAVFVSKARDGGTQVDLVANNGR